MSPLANYLRLPMPHRLNYNNIVAILEDDTVDVTMLKRICIYLLRIVFPCRAITRTEERYID